MKQIKWLFALVFSIGFALAVEWTGSVLSLREQKWASGVNAPAFMLSEGVVTALKCVMYALSIYSISRLVQSRKLTPYVQIYISISAFAALTYVCFYALHSYVGAMIFASFALAAAFAFEIFLLRSSWLMGVLYAPVLCWYFYESAVFYSLIFLN